MTIIVDDAIFKLQANGGISQIWRNIAPHLEQILSEMEPSDIPNNYYLSTYYEPAPDGINSVVVVYDFIAERYPAIGGYHLDAVKKRDAIAEAKAVIAISHWTAQDVTLFCEREASIAHCGTAIQRAEPQAVETFKQSYGIHKAYVLVVGKRGLYKNVQALYQAWQLFAKQHDFMVVCVGGEPPQIFDAAFMERYEWLQIHPTDEEMPAAYTGAEMLVYPTLYEGFGLPVLEAMACGTPVVCGARTAIPEFAGDSPYYCDVFRPMAIAQAMTAALQADYDRQVRAMQIARTYTWKRMAEKIIEAMKDIPDDD